MEYKKLPYRENLALFTDLYQLTMAQVYWAKGMDRWDSVFHYFYRTAPRGGGYSIACGLEYLVDYLSNLSFKQDDLDYLATIPGADGQPIFRPEFLNFLREFRFECDLRAVPEGTVVFPNEPIIRVSGPLLGAQIIETVLLTLCNYASAVATEASRICWAAGDAPVYDFSARRAPGIDGSLTTTRSAYLGGFAGTSNVWAARALGIPAHNVKGTMAHSLIMSFDSELEAFRAYSETLANNCLFLVDTYSTLDGIRHAITIGQELRAAGHQLLGIRLDSGDLAVLSRQARRMLDEAGFDRAVIFASNDLDEVLIRSLGTQSAAVSVWGVGTNLVIPPVGGVYKLSAIRKPGGDWQPKIKISDQPAKISIPGVLQVRRFTRDGRNVADAIFDERIGLSGDGRMISLRDPLKRMGLPPRDTQAHDLLVPIMERGRLLYELPGLDEIRCYVARQLGSIEEGTRRFENPDEYKVGLEQSLYDIRQNMILEARSAHDWGIV
jgi:nicotinate phosphoribosyltransferase